MQQRYTRLTALFLLYASLASPAHAYLDPATGSIVLQALIGIVGAAVVYYKLFVNRAKGFFRAVFRRNSERSDAD